MTSNTHMETVWAEASGAATARDKAARDLRIMTTSGSFLCLWIRFSCRTALLQQAVQVHGFNVFGAAFRAHLAEVALRCAVPVIGGPVLVRREGHNAPGHLINQSVLVPHLDTTVRLCEAGDGIGQYLRATEGLSRYSLQGVGGAYTGLHTQLCAVLEHLPGVGGQFRAGIQIGRASCRERV